MGEGIKIKFPLPFRGRVREGVVINHPSLAL